MKKVILVLVVLALLVPASAFAATEFSLGGFIKLDSFWDSTQNTKNSIAIIQRNNDQLYHHGLFGMTAQGSRFNFTIKGPKLWGATTTGFIEMDFDGSAAAGNGAGGDARQSNTSSYAPRLRHAMFRLNWPETELMFGQYWGLFSEFAPECSGDGTFMYHGWTFQRQPQIRLTQKFAGDWTVAAAILKPYDPAVAADTAFDNATYNGPGTSANLIGQASETPQLQAKLAYEADLWGKAPFYGRPRGFVAQVNAGWQRTRYRANQPTSTGAGASFSTFGQNAFATNSATDFQTSQQYLDPWCVQGTLFIPVIPTYSNNLAGSASITAEYFIGQGVAFLGAGRDADATWFDFTGRGGVEGSAREYQRRLTNQFGGYLQGQYWFTNQWFLTAIWSFTRNYGFSQAVNPGAVSGNNAAGYTYGTLNDQTKLWSEYDLTLWYRPIEALKFGLTYAYERTDFLQKVNNPMPTGTTQTTNPQSNHGASDVGESHRIQFVAYMFF